MSKQTLKKNSSGHNRPEYLKTEFKFEQQESKLVDLMEVDPSYWKEKRKHIVNDQSKKCQFV